MARAAEPTDKQSWFERGIEAAKLLQEPLSSAGAAMSGKGVQREVAEYTEVFTQVVLGMHEEMEGLQARAKTLTMLAVVALLVGLVGLGVGLWALLS